MWILESDGDFLQGKRVWLKPGKKYLFGRVKQDGVRHAIDNATISRKHLVIEVGLVKPGDGSHIHTKSQLIVSDQASKCGTTVNGESIKGQSKTLDSREEHSIRLGKYPYILRIKWCPTVLSFSLPTKELKAKDPLSHARSRLEDLDIKTIIPYVVGKTTHVVQSKRNTAKGLQALINGKHIVRKSYIEALVYAATPNDLESQESLCPLEEDFDANWPDPVPHLPPRGKEPTQRPDPAYEPNADRLTIFEGYTFIFCDGAKLEELQGPITNGHGKAILYEVEHGKTTPDELVACMQRAAGSRGLGLQDSSGGAVLVQFSAKGQHQDWLMELEKQVALRTGQRVIETSEFLDAILQNDASSLRTPFPNSEHPVASQNQAVEHRHLDTIPEDATGSHGVDHSHDESRPVKRSRARFVSKFNTFDDGFDMDAIPEYALEEGAGSAEPSQGIISEPVSNQQPMNPSFSDEDALVTDLLPGATAMKCLHLSEGRKRRDPKPPPGPEQKAKRSKLNVMEAARRRREAEDEAAMERRRDESVSLQAIVENMGLDQIQNLAVVEEMEVPSRERQSPDSANGDRWDDRWNGRKNFKKFRRKGDANNPRHRTQTVIVPLEEVRRKDFGIGQGYWTKSHDDSERHRPVEPANEMPSNPRSAGQSKSPTPPKRSEKRSRGRDSDSDEGLRFRFRRRKER